MATDGKQNLARKLIADHLIDGEMTPGADIALRIDQTLTQDATGTLVMLELEAMGLDRVQTEVSAQYVDHNLLQADHRNPDDHLFLHSACRRFGVWYSRPGNGVSHPTHMQRFGRPGRSLLGSDSHSCAAGSLGMLAMGAGGLEVAMAMAGEPFFTRMPEVFGIELTGDMPDWVSAKDVILEMLRRHGVDGGNGRIIEYHGPGLAGLSAMDRHVIANMGAELGATTSVFPADSAVRRFLAAQGREDAFKPIHADEGAAYDLTDHIDLSTLEPLIAKPSSPGHVVPVAEVAGQTIGQAYVGSSANPGYRDFAAVAHIVKGQTVPEQVSLDINPTSRSMLQTLLRDGQLGPLLAAGARLHQAGCNGCIGMGQAPASGTHSLRTVPRNFPGRSGTEGDKVWLCSPETAAASALAGQITDPRSLDMGAPDITEPDDPVIDTQNLLAPADGASAAEVTLIKGPNVVSLPALGGLPERLEIPVALILGDGISTDEIMPAGAEVLPFRSNIPKIAEFVFRAVDPDYVGRARDTGDHAIVGGRVYGQGSSREHAALAPRTLGLRVVIARNFARIHRQNLVNFGVLPLVFDGAEDYESVEQGDTLELDGLPDVLRDGDSLTATLGGRSVTLNHGLSGRQIDVLAAGGLIAWMQGGP